MSTFSQLIDELVKERMRPDVQAAAVSYANQVIRQIHSRPNTGSSIQFDANRFEAQPTLMGEAPHFWAIPNINYFQQIEAVWNQSAQVYHTERRPSVNRRQTHAPFARFFWYRTGPQIAISGAYESQVLDISYFEYPRRLPYKEAADRKVIYNEVTGEYLTPMGATPSEADLAEETNWVLQRWTPVVEQGVRNLIFSNTGDTDRARIAYSAYEQLRLQLWHEEPSTTEQHLNP